MLDFATLLMDLDHGQVNAELSTRLAEIVEAVEETAKDGTLTLTLKVRKEATRAVVDVDIKGKEPRHPIPGTLFYFGADGNLSREDPKQLKLKNLDVPATLRTVKGDES